MKEALDSLLGWLVAERLKHSSVHPESQVRVPSCHRGFSFSLESTQLYPTKWSRCLYSLAYTASFGGDVKPSVLGGWLILAFSCYFELPR